MIGFGILDAEKDTPFNGEDNLIVWHECHPELPTKEDEQPVREAMLGPPRSYS